MILTVLGCNGPYPQPNGACSGYLISSGCGNTHILLDIGPGVMARLFGYISLTSLEALILSHLHFDHMSDALALRYALDASEKERLTVIAPSEPAGVRSLLDGGKMVLSQPVAQKIGALTLSFIPAVHPVMGYSISVEEDGRRLVYTGDTNENGALDPFCANADLLLADAGLMENDWKPQSPHLSAKRCGQLARRAGARKLVLTHLSPRYAGEALLQEAREVYPLAEIAHPGLRIQI